MTSMRAVLGGSVLLITSLSPATPAIAALSISLTVKEPGVASRVAEPITSGIPLPPGTQTTSWALFDGSREIPVQVTKLRGRVPWILLDFQLDIGSGRTKILTLKEQAPQPAAPDLAPTAPPTRRTVVLAGSDKVIEGVPEKETWEYRGPLRAVLRVDGKFGDVPGFGFTTRYTFYAGKKYVRVEHVLRNSLQANQRQLKLTSALITIASGESKARAAYIGSIVAVGGSGVTFEMLPTQQPGVRDPKKRQGVNVADNGGYLLPDLTHYGAAVVWDPDKENRAPASPLFALAEPAWYGEWGELSTNKFGSLEDERETYRRLGWKWSAKKEPSYPHEPDYAVPIARVSVHFDSESDDLWGNILMYLRSGVRGYFDRARGWANYYKWEMAFRTDGFKYAWDGDAERPHVVRPAIASALTPWDRYYLRQVMDGKVDTHTWIGCHVWGWSLLDYYYLTGDLEAVEGAADIGESVETLWLWRGEYNPIYGTRNIARNLLLAVRLYDTTEDLRWKALADHIVGLALRTPFWLETWGTYAWPRKGGGHAVGPHHLAEYHHALWQYDLRIGNPEVHRRLIKMATFVRDHAMHPRWQHSAKIIVLDSPTPGAVQYQDWNDDQEPQGVNPYHTFVWVNTLVRGYRLTGDKSFLAKALYFWDRGSKAQYRKPANYRFAGDGEVGRFSNSSFECCWPHPLYFKLNGDLQFVHLLFWDAARTTVEEYKPDTNPKTGWAPASRNDRGAAIRTVTYEEQEQTSGASHLRELGANQWRQVKPPTRTIYQSVLTMDKNSTDCGRSISDGNPIFRSYSGLATGDGIVFYFGGGHAGHPGNDVDLYSIEENRWTIPYPPECPEPGTAVARQVKGGGVATRGISPTGRPWVHHSYQNSRYDPPRKRFIFMGGEGTWAFDLFKRDWIHLVDRKRSLGPTWGSTGGMVYDPQHDRMVAFVSTSANGAARGTYHFDLRSNRWSFAGGFPTGEGYSFAYKVITAAVAPLRREAIILTIPDAPQTDGPRLWRYHLDQESWTHVKSFGSRDVAGSPAAEIPTQSASWDLDTRNHRAVFLVTPRDGKDGTARLAQTWSWDPERDTWVLNPPADVRPKGGSRYSFVYDERHNVFVYIEVKSLYCDVGGGAACGGPTNTWIYRLAGTTPSGASRGTRIARQQFAAAASR